MRKIVYDAANRLNISTYQVFANAYKVMGHPERIALANYRECKDTQLPNEIVENYCLDVLTTRTPVVHGRNHVCVAS